MIINLYSKDYLYGVVAKEISRISKYVSRLIQLPPVANDSNILFGKLEAPDKVTLSQISDLDCCNSSESNLILLNGHANHTSDLLGLLGQIYSRMNRESRVALVLYNPYLKFFFELASKLGLRQAIPEMNFLTMTNLRNFTQLAGFEIVRSRNTVFLPVNIPGISFLVNSLFPAIPFIKKLSFLSIVILRPILKEVAPPAISIIIPARNEYGNIENGIKRVLALSFDCSEVIFVEGHSQDRTWEEILRVKELYGSQITIKAVQQSGEGKANAVEEGVLQAEFNLIAILDADLTMPPELLPRFFAAYCQGHGDFINGNRLVYPMEGKAMMFLNQIGNVFFAKALSHVLEYPIGDSLCGTKLFTKSDFQRFQLWRQDFGEFDPFGDFNLLFPAVILGLGVVDLPINYRNRIYGKTNIRRFYHGLMLLKMVFVGMKKVRLGSG